ncbi:MAG: GNAT family N-acetyltransferase [Wenzhouxiangellaceae bacterium]
MTSFITRRLLIRPWRADDREELHRWTGDVTMMRYITDGRPWDTEEVDELMKRQQRHLDAHDVCFGAVQRLDDARLVGLAGMQPLDTGDFELGWWIWKDHWGRGYAPEAIAPFIEHARNTMGLQRLVAVIDPPNSASIRVAEKIGMRFERNMSARDTIAKRPDKVISLYAMSLR